MFRSSIQALRARGFLSIQYIPACMSLEQVVKFTLNTGEKLETGWEFIAFMGVDAINMTQPDLVFAGGYSGFWRIADHDEQFAIPLTMHNVGAVLWNAMTAKFVAATVTL